MIYRFTLSNRIRMCYYKCFCRRCGLCEINSAVVQLATNIIYFLLSSTAYFNIGSHKRLTILNFNLIFGPKFLELIFISYEPDTLFISHFFSVPFKINIIEKNYKCMVLMSVSTLNSLFFWGKDQKNTWYPVESVVLISSGLYVYIQGHGEITHDHSHLLGCRSNSTVADTNVSYNSKELLLVSRTYEWISHTLLMATVTGHMHGKGYIWSHKLISCE